ncbi:unnamed protein product [Trichobilharzia szidati]|nr:unnamed protein product [Trichobilharzia szidati]
MLTTKSNLIAGLYSVHCLGTFVTKNVIVADKDDVKLVISGKNKIFHLLGETHTYSCAVKFIYKSLYEFNHPKPVWINLKDMGTEVLGTDDIKVLQTNAGWHYYACEFSTYGLIVKEFLHFIVFDISKHSLTVEEDGIERYFYIVDSPISVRCHAGNIGYQHLERPYWILLSGNVTYKISNRSNILQKSSVISLHNKSFFYGTFQCKLKIKNVCLTKIVVFVNLRGSMPDRLLRRRYILPNSLQLTEKFSLKQYTHHELRFLSEPVCVSYDHRKETIEWHCPWIRTGVLHFCVEHTEQQFILDKLYCNDTKVFYLENVYQVFARLEPSEMYFHYGEKIRCKLNKNVTVHVDVIMMFKVYPEGLHPERYYTEWVTLDQTFPSGVYIIRCTVIVEYMEPLSTESLIIIIINVIIFLCIHIIEDPPTNVGFYKSPHGYRCTHNGMPIENVKYNIKVLNATFDFEISDDTVVIDEYTLLGDYIVKCSALVSHPFNKTYNLSRIEVLRIKVVYTCVVGLQCRCCFVSSFFSNNFYAISYLGIKNTTNKKYIQIHEFLEINHLIDSDKEYQEIVHQAIHRFDELVALIRAVKIIEERKRDTRSTYTEGLNGDRLLDDEVSDYMKVTSKIDNNVINEQGLHKMSSRRPSILLEDTNPLQRRKFSKFVGIVLPTDTEIEETDNTFEG